MVTIQTQPSTLEAMRGRLDRLIGEVQDIEVQLGDRDRRHADGTPLSSVEYWQWRNAAVAARKYKLREYRDLKAAYKAACLEARNTALPEGETLTATATVDEWLALYRLFKDLFKSGRVGYTAAEWDALKPLERALRATGLRDDEYGL